MVIYKKRSKPILRYVIALVVLTLGLTLTFADVYGLQMPYGQSKHNSGTVELEKHNSGDEIGDIVTNDFDIDIGTGNDDSNTDDTNPTSVPEPSTLILLASGLGLLRMAHKKK